MDKGSVCPFDEIIIQVQIVSLASCRLNQGTELPDMNASSNDDAESVDAFLERIASLKNQRNQEDEEHTRKLEEDILQGRRERQARRAGK